MLTTLTIKVTGKLLEQYMNNFYWTKRKENTIPPISGNTKIYDFVVPTSAQTVHTLNSGSGLTRQIAKYNSFDSKHLVNNTQFIQDVALPGQICNYNCLPYAFFFEDFFSLTQVFQ